MAQFKFERLKDGYDGEEITEYLSLVEITAEPGDEVITVPERYQGEPVTAIGFVQDFLSAHEHFHDWHHPGQGSEWVPDHYSLAPLTIALPDFVKKIVLPATVKRSSYYPFGSKTQVIIEIDPENPYLRVDGKCVY